MYQIYVCPKCIAWFPIQIYWRFYRECLYINQDDFLYAIPITHKTLPVPNDVNQIHVYISDGNHIECITFGLTWIVESLLAVYDLEIVFSCFPLHMLYISLWVNHICLKPSQLAKNELCKMRTITTCSPTFSDKRCLNLLPNLRHTCNCEFLNNSAF